MSDLPAGFGSFDFAQGPLAATNVPPPQMAAVPSGLGAPVFGDPNNPLIRVGMQAAQQNGVPWPVFYHAIKGESGWNPNIGPSSTGARGIAQFIPSTARMYGVDTSDPTSSLFGAAKYLADLRKQGGSWTGALTGYLTGNPKGSPPQDVLRSNPSYTRAFQLAGMQDGIIDPGVRLSAETNPMGGGVVGEPLELGTLKEMARIDPFQAQPRSPVGAGSAGGPALTQTDLQRGLQGVLQNQQVGGSSNTAWQKLMMFSMMSQAMNAGTHQFVPISYDPWKIVPSMGGHQPMPVPNTGMYL